MSEKGEKLERVEQIEKTDSEDGKHDITVESASVTSRELDSLDLDPAAQFLFEHKDVDTSQVNIDKLRHKIDRNVVSIMALCFIMQFLDKAVYNVSHFVCSGSLIINVKYQYTAVMGLKEDLHFQGNDFSHVATAYAVGHLVMQFPNGMFRLSTQMRAKLNSS